jgi:hypothetical protein
MTIRFLISYCLILNVVNIQASLNPHLITAAITLFVKEPQDQPVATPSTSVKNNHQKIDQQEKEYTTTLPRGGRPAAQLRRKGSLNQPQQRGCK